MSGVPQLVVKLLYGCGLRIMECLRLRIQDIDIDMKQIRVKSGKGDKDRITTFPTTIIPTLLEHMQRVQIIQDSDLEKGFGEVYMPGALAKNIPMLQKNGDGSMYSQQEIFLLIHGRAKKDDTILIQAL